MRFPLFLCSLFSLVISTVINIGAQTAGTLFTVNSTADTADVVPGDGLCADAKGQCSLRAAIQESNIVNLNGRNVIAFALPNPSVIGLTLGELAITRNTSIVGPGARRLTIERSSAPGTGSFRIFRVANIFPQVDIRGVKMRNGDAWTGNGGAILIEQGGNLNLSDVAITENRAASGGVIANTGTVTTSRCLVTSNTADQNGGIFSEESVGGIQVFDSTITANSATAGGAIHTDFAANLVNDTITANTASKTAQSIFNGGVGIQFWVINTIIGDDASSAVTSLSGSFLSLGNNIVTDARGSTGFVNGVNNDRVSDNNAINPLLGGIADNGGQTDTRTLLAGSPAINHGNNCVLSGTCSFGRFLLRTDQRGFLRPLFGGQIDIGASEAESIGSAPVNSIGFGFRNGSFYTGAIAVLTGATSGQKVYKPMSPFGRVEFTGLNETNYVLEFRTKRSIAALFPIVISLEDSPPLAFAPDPPVGLKISIDPEN